MDYLIVAGAGIAGFAFGAVWYTIFGKAWQRSTGLTDEDVRPGNSAGAYVTGIIASILVAGMMRHVFATSAVSGLWEGAVSGFGFGLFIAGSYLALNYAFAKRPYALRLIDIGHAAGSATVIGAILGAVAQ